MSRPSHWLWLLALAALTAGGCTLPSRAPQGEAPMPAPAPPPAPVQQTSHISPALGAARPPADTTSNWPHLVKPPAPNEAQLPPLSPLPEITTPAPTPVTAAPREPLVLALECVLDNRHQEALKHLQSYDPQTQEFLLRVLPALSLFAKKRLEDLPPAEVNALDEQVCSLQTFLRQRAQLAITRLRFCESIKGYAVYQPLAEDHEFTAAQGGRPGELVQLYVELRNFGSVPRQGFYETNLTARVEITDPKGHPRWSHEFSPEALKLVSRHRLSEYYEGFSFFVPPGLAPGEYRLTVVLTDVTDPQTPRRASAAIPMRIAAGR